MYFFIPVPLYTYSFVKQYYEMMAKNPSELHKFYNDDSAFSHCENNQVIFYVCNAVYSYPSLLVLLLI